MSSFGVIATGFRAKTLQDVLDEMESAQRAAFGPTINTQADSVLGQINGIVGDKIAELWEVNNAVYRARQADSANDEALDNVGAITGAVRLPAQQSTRTLKLNVNDTVTIDAGKLASIGVNGEQWQLKTAVTNSTGANATLDGEFESVNFGPIVGNPSTIDTIKTPVSGWSAKAAIDSLASEPFFLADGETLLVEIDQAAAQTVTFNTADFVSITAATAQEVIDAIVADITSGISGIDVSGVIRLVSDLDGSGSALRITGGTAAEALGFSQAEFKGFNNDTPAQSINATAETYALVDAQTLTVKVDDGTPQVVTFNTADFVAIGAATAREVAKVITADLTGAVAYVVGDKIQIESLVVGVNSEIEVTGGTANTALGFAEQAFSGASGAATLGRNIEEDPAYRLRREQLLRISGAATLEAVRSALIATTDVLQAFIFENPTDLTDVNGLPPHSFEAVVSGGTDQAVAQTIFDTKPLGIATHRDPGADGRTVAIVDSQGISHDINFSRPTEIQMFVEVDISIVAAVFGGGVQSVGEALVKNAIEAVGDLLQIGEDVIVLPLQCAPLDVAGVVDVPVLKVEDSFPPTNTANIVIASRDLATFASTDIVVNIV